MIPINRIFKLRNPWDYLTEKTIEKKIWNIHRNKSIIINDRKILYYPELSVGFI